LALAAPAEATALLLSRRDLSIASVEMTRLGGFAIGPGGI